METIKGACPYGKERLLNEDLLTLPNYHNANKKRRCIDKIYVMMFVTILSACVVSCICAIYCQKTLAEIKSIKESNIVENKKSDKDLLTATEKSQQSSLGYDIDSTVDEVVNLDYEDLDDELDDEELEEYSDHEQDDEDDDSDDLDHDGSGEEATNKQTRKRRDAADDKCSQNCSEKKGKSKRKCLRRCSRGNKNNGNKATQMVNLPSAQFEIKFTETQIQNLVKVGHDQYINKEDVPLKVFKPSSWFDNTTSPVTFDNARAIAKKTGIYLVYGQVFIGGKDAKKSIKLVQKRNEKDVSALSCRTGVHPDHYDSMSDQLQTCSVLGLVNLLEGDTVEVQMAGDTTMIILDKDKTYFGIVQLSNFAAQKSQKKRKRKN